MDSTKTKKGVSSRLKHLILFALVSFVSVCDIFAITGKGTKADPYKISNVADLNTFRGYCSYSSYLYVELLEDLVLKTNLQNTCPIGGFTGNNIGWNYNSSKTFCGEFNGNGHTISVEMPASGTLNNTSANFGVFGKVGTTSSEKTIIKDLNVKYTSSRVIAYKGFGTIVGEASNVRIENCHVIEGTTFTISNAMNGGGIVGQIDHGEIVDCSVVNSTFNFTSVTPKRVGGICSIASSTVITNCHVSNATLNAPNSSGIVADMKDGVVKECSFTGVLGNGNNIMNSGGICGIAENDVTIFNSYSRFALNVGGTIESFGNLVGSIGGGANVKIKNCYASGSASLKEGTKATNYGSAIASVGTASTNIVENCFVQVDLINIPTTINGVAADKEKDVDFMKSGCLAELLNEYAETNKADLECSGVPLWYEDKTSINDCFAILRGQVEEKYRNDVPFCHPNIFTFENTPKIVAPNYTTTLSGKLQYVTEIQKSLGWIYGFEVTEGGSKKYITEGLAKTVEEDGSISFTIPYTISGKKTAVYRAFVQETSGEKRIATGREYELFYVEQQDQTIEECDSAEYNGKWYYETQAPFVDEEGNTITIIVNHADSTDVLKIDSRAIDQNCSYWNYMGEKFSTNGHHIVSATVGKTAKGCRKFSYLDVNNLSKPTIKMDSVYVMTLDNLKNSYIYTINYKVSTIVHDTYKAKVGSDYVSTPTDLSGTTNLAVPGDPKDKIQYKDKDTPLCYGKDSIIITGIKYVSPVKFREAPVETLCGATDIEMNGETFHVTSDTTILEVKKYTGADIAVQLGTSSYYSGIDTLYDVVSHSYKVTNTVIETIQVDEKNARALIPGVGTVHGYIYTIGEDHKMCKDDRRVNFYCDRTTEDVTLYVVVNGGEKLYYNTLEEAKVGCPEKISIEKHVYSLCEDMEVKKDITVCGQFKDPNSGKVYTTSGVIRSPQIGTVPMAESCTGKGFYTYNLVVNPAPELETIELHGCGSIEYKNKKGETVTLTGTGVYEDKLEPKFEGDCADVTHVNYTVHPTPTPEDFPVSGCDQVEYTYLDGHKQTFTASTSFKDVKKVVCAKGCDCDEVVRNVNIVVGSNIVNETEHYTGCDKYIYNNAGKSITILKDTMFEVQKPNPGGCFIYQPVEVKIFKTTNKVENVVACDKYVCEDGWFTDQSATHVIATTDEYGCKNTVTYNVTIASTQVLKDTTAYGCDTLFYNKLDGTVQMFTSDATFTDELKSDDCDGAGVTQKVNVVIYKTEIKDLAPVEHCGSMMFTVPSQSKKIEVKSSCVISDTTYNEHGCMQITRTRITIKPVKVVYDTVQACKTYNSFPALKYENGRPSGYASYTVEDSTVVEQDFVFAQPTAYFLTSFGCLDTTYRHVVVHGVSEKNLETIKACEEYEYTKMDGTTEVITASGTITDVLKSKTCNCDSLINHVNIVINHSSPVSPTVHEITNCDSVVYMRGTKRLAFFMDDAFSDTLVNQYGCDSVVKYKAIVNHSVLEHKFFTVCRDTNLNLQGVPTLIENSGVYRDKIGTTPQGCDSGIEYHITVEKPETETKKQSACGSIRFNGQDYTTVNDKVNEVTLNLAGKTKCDPDTLFTLSVYPTYDIVVDTADCFQVTYDDILYTSSINKTLNLKTVSGGCDSIIHLNVVVHEVNEADSVTTISSLYLDSEYRKDTVIYDTMVNKYGCEYIYTKKYTVIPPVLRFEDVNICRRYTFPHKDLAVYKGVTYANDTTLVDELRHNKTNNDTILTTNIYINEPQHEYIVIDSCMQVTYNGVVFTDSAEFIEFDPLLKTKEFGCDSIVHVKVNVGKCFPYPVLVSKYDWILICNDNIMTEDKFRKLGGVKYRWYKNNALVSETSENYYTENVPLNGCYYVAVVTSEGYEYTSDEMCFNQSHNVTLAPNPAVKGRPVTIDCSFRDEPVEGTKVEVYNAIAIKVFDTVATSSTILIPGKAIPTAGHYFVKLTTEGGYVLTTKFVVK